MANNSVLAKLAVKISADTAEFGRAMSATQKSLTGFTNGITKIAGTLGIAFGTQQVISFAFEVSKLAGEAEGVRAAFERLPNSTKLMEDLKEATGGTVSELGLMKRAVQASNFDISLSALPRLLEFATLRAQQTGQSVDYLVDSIVTGIGRKSKLILDNLGISAVQLNEALGGASTAAASIGEVADAVGKIAEANLKNMAGFSENAATKVQRLEASWENVKVAIGAAANGTGVLAGAIDGLGKQMDVLSSGNIPLYLKALNLVSFGLYTAQLQQIDFIKNQVKINQEQAKQAQIIREVDRYFKEFNGDIDAYGKTIETHIYRTELLAEFTKRLNNENKNQLETYAQLKEIQDELNQQFETATSRNDIKELQNIGDKIKAIQKQIDTLDALRKAQKPGKDPLEGKFQFIPDLEAEGSLNLELRNEQDANQLKELTKTLGEVATSAEFAGGAVIQLENQTGQSTKKMKEGWIDLSGSISNAIIGIAESLGELISGTNAEFEQAKQRLGELKKGTDEYEKQLDVVAAARPDFGKNMINILVSFARQVGEILVGIGTAMLAAQKAISNPYTAIAAGIALIALSGALSTKLNGAQAGFNSGSGSSGSGGRSAFSAVSNSQVQDNKIIAETIIRGQDIYVVLKNYEQGKQYTSASNG
jgi:uncharacterized protein Yka (UPF0111/DUF47 family)